MKEQIITTDIIVPERCRSYRNEVISVNNEAVKKFKVDISAALELPEDYETYLKWDASNSFISLYSRSLYGMETSFRKFTRGKKATYPFDLPEKLKFHIEKIKNNVSKQKDEFDSFKHYLALTSPARKVFCTSQWTISMDKDKSINIIYHLPNKEWIFLGKCSIMQNGTIPSPELSTEFGKQASIADVEQWLTAMKPINVIMLAKAEEIKAALPAEYFINHYAGKSD